MLEFVGLGLYDERSITRRGAEAIRVADVAYLEAYTSVLAGTTVERLEAVHGRSIEVLDRDAVERHADDLLDGAATSRVAFLTGGDPMVATTHVDLRLRAHDRGIETRLVHGTSAQTAAAGLTGLQAYRFGRSATVPFPEHAPGDAVPPSVFDAIDANRARGLHTLLFLDIALDDVDRAVLRDELDDRCLDAPAAADQLADRRPDALGVA
ncbi:MAG: diphthine synthase, partial [Halobacteriales archaeon]